MTKQIKIAIVSPSQNTYSETFIQAHLKLKGDIYYYYGGLTPKYLRGYGSLSLINIFSIYYLIKHKFCLGTPLLKIYGQLLEYSFLRSLRKNKIQVVLAEYGTTGASIYNVCKKLKIPLIVHFHGYDASQKKTIEKYRNEYEKMFEYSNSVVAVSKKMIKDLIDLGCPSNKIILNTYGPAEAFFDIEPNRDSKQFLSIGRFVDKKAPYLTILAFVKIAKKFPDAKLVMIGDGELLGVCKNLVKVTGVEEQVSFLGVLTPEEIKNTMTKSLAFVQHSIIAENGDSEGTPVAVIEASSASLAVIATIHAGIPDVIINGQTGLLVNELDVEKMSKNMEELLTNPLFAKKLGENGRNHIRSNFSLEQHLQKLDDLILSAVK